jgi:hypothetical protein
MKWYWAILQTIIIFAVLLLVGPTEPTKAAGFGSFVFALFAIWVAADSSSFGWGIFVFLLWPIAYPWYLIVRPKVRPKVLPSHEQARENKLNQASKLDQRGDWSQAIALYEQIVEESQGQQHAEYARNCVQRIREKMKIQ